MLLLIITLIFVIITADDAVSAEYQLLYQAPERIGFEWKNKHEIQYERDKTIIDIYTSIPNPHPRMQFEPYFGDPPHPQLIHRPQDVDADERRWRFEFTHSEHCQMSQQFTLYIIASLRINRSPWVNDEDFIERPIFYKQYPQPLSINIQDVAPYEGFIDGGILPDVPGDTQHADQARIEEIVDTISEGDGWIAQQIKEAMCPEEVQEDEDEEAVADTQVTWQRNRTPRQSAGSTEYPGSSDMRHQQRRRLPLEIVAVLCIATGFIILGVIIIIYMLNQRAHQRQLKRLRRKQSALFRNKTYISPQRSYQTSSQLPWARHPRRDIVP